MDGDGMSGERGETIIMVLVVFGLNDPSGQVRETLEDFVGVGRFVIDGFGLWKLESWIGNGGFGLGEEVRVKKIGWVALGRAFFLVT